MTDPDSSHETHPSVPDEPSGGGLVGIGQAARILDREFSDVSVSKLRYLEARGLVTPTRTRGGSRRFSPQDIERLRYIIGCQRDEFLPLDVIARRLANPSPDDVGPRQVRPVSAGPGTPGGSEGTESGSLAHLLRPRGSDSTETELTPAQFTKRAPVSSDAIEKMRQHGLINHWDATELAITEIIGRLQTYGIEPRHLRWLTQSADRTTALVDASLPIRHELGSLAEAENDEARRHLAADLIAVYLLLVRNALSRS